MATIILHGVITPDGRLEVDLPPDMPAGPVEVEIKPQRVEGVSLGDLLNSELVGIWEDRADIEDSVEFARQLRRRASRGRLE